MSAEHQLREALGAEQFAQLTKQAGNALTSAFKTIELTTMSPTHPQFTLIDLAEKLGCHVQPYPGGGAQVFIGRAEIVNPQLYREFWNLSDAHVVGTLSGPSLHIVGNIPVDKELPALCHAEAFAARNVE